MSASNYGTTPEGDKKIEEQEKKGFLARGLSAVSSKASQAKDGLKGAAGKVVSAGKAVVGTGADTIGGGYGKTLNTYDHLFLKHINREFGDHLEVASRGAVFVVICAIPFVMPGEICHWCDDIVHEGYYTATCVTYFIYTLYSYAGDIIHFAQGGVTGTILAVLNIWLMQGFMPGGYSPSMPHRWWLANLWGITFVFVILWLNFDDLTRVFGLSTYVWYWMVFIQPDATAGFSQNFEIRLDGRAVREFMVAFIGCGLALIAAYVPYPIFAHNKAMDVSKNLLSQAFATKTDFLKYYCGAKKDPMIVKILRREMETMQGEVGAIASLLDSAWYECLGRGRSRVQQDMMRKFSEYISKTIDLLSNGFEICQYESFNELHVELMAEIKKPLQDIVKGNAAILEKCITGLDDTKFSPETQEEVEAMIQGVQNSLKELTENLQKIRKAKNFDRVCDDVSGENVVALTFAKFVHQTAAFYHVLVEMTTEKSAEQLQAEKEKNPPKGMFAGTLFDTDALKDKDHIMWTLRNGFSIIIAFFVGWHGYNQYISQYNAQIASTVCVLLSKFVGSAMIKNLARLQGVVIGIVLGNLLYAFLAWCYWWGHLLVAFALYSWTLLGLFMYFHSTNYSTVGLLLVVFGTQSLLRPCANTETDPKGHGSIVNVTVAICIMTIIDIFLSPARASDMSLKLFQEAHTGLQKAVTDLFDFEIENIPSREVALGKAIAAAKSMGVEAGLEPRYQRHDWPTHKYDQAISCLETVRFCMQSIETIVLEHKHDNEKKSYYLEALKLKPFCGEGGVKDALLKHFASVMKAVEKAIGDKANHDVFLRRFAEIDELEASNYGKQSTLQDFIKELDADTFKVQSDESKKDVSKDPLADLSLVVESLNTMFTSLDACLEACVD